MDLRREETQKTTGEPEVTEGVTGMLLLAVCLLRYFASLCTSLHNRSPANITKSPTEMFSTKPPTPDGSSACSAQSS